MTDKILGLDIGEDTVKAVLAAGSAKEGHRIHGASIVHVGEAGGLTGALQKLFQNPEYRGCACVTALPARNISFRNVTLPFRNEKKIRQTIAFALEPLIRHGVDDVLIDFVIAGTDESSEIFAAVAPRTAIRDRLTMLDGHVKKTEPLDVDGVTAACRLLAGGSETGCGLLLDIGASRTVAAFVRGGRLVQVREFTYGGRPTTEALAEIWGIGFDEAELRKKQGLTAPGTGALPPCESFLAELKRTVDFLAWQGRIEQGISRILLTGGGALYLPLQDGLSRAFSVPVALADLSGGSDIIMDPAVRARWQPAFMNQALALATRGPKKGSGFRFSEREGKFKDAYARFRGKLHWAAAVLLMFALLGLTDFYLDYRYAAVRNTRLKDEIAALFRQYNPEAKKIVDPLAQMKGGIMEARKVSRGMDENGHGVTVLAVLKDISALAPSGTDLLLSSFTLENDVVTIRGQAGNFDAVDAVKRELAKSKYFSSVTIGATNLLKQGERVEFDMQMMIK
jgi:general secretion pathway protein L